MMALIFFFSSRRRHTRSLRDWSSDVCSSDLEAITEDSVSEPGMATEIYLEITRIITGRNREAIDAARSEERRVGKERRRAGPLYHERKKKRYASNTV